MSETPSSSSQVEVTIRHHGDLSKYEAPVVTMTKGGVAHPMVCQCGCGSETGAGGGHTVAAD